VTYISPMKDKIIICGKSGSGKDHLLRTLIKEGYNYSPKITTRPKRKGEINGKDYTFISNERFIELIESREMTTHQKFTINGEDWYYGISKENIENNDIFIMTPYEMRQISDFISKFKIIYLDIDREIRKRRIAKREDINDSIERRLDADDLDFLKFENEFQHTKIKNPLFTKEEILVTLKIH